MNKKLWSLFSVLLIATMMLAACGPAATPTAEPTEAIAAPTEAVVEPTKAPTEAVVEPTATPEPTAAVVEPVATLRIWADDTRTPLLQELADDFLAKYNVELVVEDLGKVQDIRSQVIIAVPAGEGPDIYIGVHDWLGALVDSGLAAPIDLGDKRDAFVEFEPGGFYLYRRQALRRAIRLREPWFLLQHRSGP